MPNDRVDSPEVQAAASPDDGTPGGAVVPEAPAVEAGAPAAAPAEGSPAGEPEIPVVGQPDPEPVEEPTKEPSEHDYEQRFKDTKADRDRLAAAVNRLRDAGLVDEDGAPISRPQAPQAPAAEGEPNLAQLLDKSLDEMVQAVADEHGPRAAYRLSQQLEQMTNQQAAAPARAPVAPAQPGAPPQSPSQDDVRAMIRNEIVAATERGDRIEMSLNGLSEQYGKDFMDGFVNYKGRPVPRRSWLDAEATRTGSDPAQILLAQDQGSVFKHLVGLATEESRTQAVREQTGQGAPVGMPAIPLAPVDDSISESHRRSGGRVGSDGPIPRYAKEEG